MLSIHVDDADFILQRIYDHRMRAELLKERNDLFDAAEQLAIADGMMTALELLAGENTDIETEYQKLAVLQKQKIV